MNPAMDKGAPKFKSPQVQAEPEAPPPPMAVAPPFPRFALFQEIPGDSGEVRFRYTGHGKSMGPLLVTLFVSVIGVIASVKAAQRGQMNKLLAWSMAGFCGLFGLGLLFALLRALGTHLRMIIDPGTLTLKIETRTPFSTRNEDYSMEDMVSVLVCIPPDAGEEDTPYRVSVEMRDGTYLDLGCGPRPEAVTVGRRIAFLLNRPFRLS
jgi:hypothetical protein